MRPIQYIINDDGEPEPCEDTLRWAVWFEDIHNRVVLQDRFGPLLVSTVFLGLDHNWLLTGPPVLWETMVFDESDGRKSLDDYSQRYTSKLEALEGHHEICVAVEALATK
jgi:hypothetical protein